MKLLGQNHLRSMKSAEPNEPAPGGKFVQETTDRTGKRPSFWERRRPTLSYVKRQSPLVLGSAAKGLGASWQSVVRITHDREQVALGTVVDSDGWIITKASQLPDLKSVTCVTHDLRKYPAEVVKLVPNLDLALLRIEQAELTSADWASAIPERGKFVATMDMKVTPSGLGVVSAGVQRIPYQKSVLGVLLVNGEEGARVDHVLVGSGGERAGLKENDTIYEVDGIAVQTHIAFKQAIRDAQGGDYVALKLKRGDKKLAIKAQLMDLASELLYDTEMEVNGAVSARSSNFERVLSHDTAIRPNQCGGPLVNLDGQVVGINIARAGRVTSYALPYDIVQPVVSDLIRDAKLVSRNAEKKSTSGNAVR